MVANNQLIFTIQANAPSKLEIINYLAPSLNVQQRLPKMCTFYQNKIIEIGNLVLLRKIESSKLQLIGRKRTIIAVFLGNAQLEYIIEEQESRVRVLLSNN